MEKLALTVLIPFFLYAMVSADVMMLEADKAGAAGNSEALYADHDAGSTVSVTSDDTCSGKVSASATSVMLEYYSTQGIITDPGKYAYLYEGLPSDVEKLAEVVQGVMIHIAHAHRYGVELSEERRKEIFMRKVEEMLGRIIELDTRPITQVRNPEKRFVGVCRHYAVFICSLLRHKGIPSRARCVHQ